MCYNFGCPCRNHNSTSYDCPAERFCPFVSYYETYTTSDHSEISPQETYADTKTHPLPATNERSVS